MARPKVDVLADQLSELTGSTFRILRTTIITDAWVTEKGRPRRKGYKEVTRYSIRAERDDEATGIQFGEVTFQETTKRLAMMIDLIQCGFIGGKKDNGPEQGTTESLGSSQAGEGTPGEPNGAGLPEDADQVRP